jgi:hypothetical protein
MASPHYNRRKHCIYRERNGLCDAPHKALLLVREKEKYFFLLCYENMRILDHEDS